MTCRGQYQTFRMTSIRQRFTLRATLSPIARTSIPLVNASPSNHETCLHRDRFPRSNNNIITVQDRSLFSHQPFDISTTGLRRRRAWFYSICFTLAGQNANGFPFDSFQQFLCTVQLLFLPLYGTEAYGFTFTIVCCHRRAPAPAYRMTSVNQLRLFNCLLRAYRVFAKTETLVRRTR